MRRTLVFTVLLAAIVSLATAESPFTTRDGDLGWVYQTPNYVLAGPATGSTTAEPTFRALVLADIPDNATQYKMLQSGGASAAPAWSTAIWPATTTISQILYSSSANTVTGLATANSSVLVTNSGGVPAWGTVLPSIGDLTFLTGLAGGADIAIASAAADTAGQSLDITGQAGGAAGADQVGKNGGTVTLTGGAGSAKNGAGATDGDGGDLILVGGARGGSTGGTEVHGIVRVGTPTVGSTRATNLLAVAGGFEVDGASRLDGGVILGTAASDTITVNGTLLSSATIGANPEIASSSLGIGTTGIIFEGATADAIEGLLTAADPTSADKTWTLPNTSGTLITSGDSGTVSALMLQSAAADLGAASVTINLGNTNGAFDTNLTTDGTITAGAFSGPLTGNVTGDCSGSAGSVAGANVGTSAVVATYGGTGINTAGSSGVPIVTAGTWSVPTTLPANLLQSAAADLGAASVTVDLSNTNGAFVTNLTLDGRVTTDTLTLGGTAITATGAQINAVAGSLDFRLASVQVDVGAVADTTLYTVPGGKSAVITKIVIHSASASFNQATDPIFAIGYTAADYQDVVASATYTTPSSTTGYILPTIIAEPHLGAAAEVLKFHVTQAATASTTATVDVIGYTF